MTSTFARNLAMSVDAFAVEPSEAAVEARTQELAYATYVEGATVWRSGRVLFAMSVFLLAFGAFPALPGAAPLVGAPLSLTMGVMIGQILISVVCSVRLWNHEPSDRVYSVLSWIDAQWWLGGLSVLIWWSGSARSPYWLGVAAFVVLMSQNVYRKRLYARVLGMSLGGLTLAFLWQGLFYDAAFTVMTAVCVAAAHRLSSTLGWERERLRARSELLTHGLAEARAARERERITRDLHDGLAADLTAVLWRAQAMDGGDQLTMAIRQSLATLRQIIDATAGLPMSVRGLADEAVRIVEPLAVDGLQVNIAIDPHSVETELSAPVCEAVLRVVQEGVRNAATHGRAHTIDVHLCAGQTMGVRVVDDGVGVDPAAPRGHGLRNLRLRAEELGGDMALMPADPAGTEMVWWVPTDAGREAPVPARPNRR